MPIRRRTSIGSTSGAYRSWPWNASRPETSAPAMRSFMRLNVRRNVLLPHPDGPMSAVIRRREHVERDALDRDDARVAHRDVAGLEDDDVARRELRSTRDVARSRRRRRPARSDRRVVSGALDRWAGSPTSALRHLVRLWTRRPSASGRSRRDSAGAPHGSLAGCVGGPQGLAVRYRCHAGKRQMNRRRT